MDLSQFKYWDQQLLLLINTQWSSPFLDLILPDITDLHKNFVFVLACVLGLGFFIYKYRWQACSLLLAVAAAIGSGDAFCGHVIKPWFARTRPNNAGLGVLVKAPEYGGFSFPSNHSFNMFCLAAFVTFYFPRWAWLFFIAAAVVGYSRVYVGVHYPTDVLGGALLGMTWGLICAKVFQQWLKGKTHG